MVSAAFRSVFALTDPDEVIARWDEVTTTLEARFPKAAQHMTDARTDVLAFASLGWIVFVVAVSATWWARRAPILTSPLGAFSRRCRRFRFLSQLDCAELSPTTAVIRHDVLGYCQAGTPR